MNPNVSIIKETRLAKLYASCGKKLKLSHASAQVIKVNELWLGRTCIILGSIGGNAGDLPTCD